MLLDCLMMRENYDLGRRATLYTSRRMHIYLIPWLIKLASEVCHLLAEPPLLAMLLIEATCERIRYIDSAEWMADLGHSFGTALFVPVAAGEGCHGRKSCFRHYCSS
jgi:hypothetical protein